MTSESEAARAQRQRRHYETSPLAVLLDGAGAPAREATLLALYGEVSRNWCRVVEVRYRLLGAVAAASILLLAIILKPEAAGGLTLPVQIGLALLGLAATAGLFLYDLHNARVYNDLISRGRKIEAALGVDTGQFLGSTPRGRLVQHDRAAVIVFGSVMVAWAAAIVAIWARL